MAGPPAVHPRHQPARSQLEPSERQHGYRPVPPPGSGPPIAAGGIANGGNAVLNATQVDNNTATATSGAGIVNHGTMTINWSEVNHNTAAGKGGTASGGGIVNADISPITGATTSGVLTINHSQVNGNSAGGLGGGILNGLPSPKMPLGARSP